MDSKRPNILAIRRKACFSPNSVEKDRLILQLVCDELKKIGHLPAFKLVDLSHLPNSPWDITFKKGAGNGQIIPDHLIQDYFSS